MQTSEICYLDNAAATPPSPEVLDFFKKSALTVYANQEAVHGAAYSVRQLLDQAAGNLVKSVTNSSNGNVFWCDSGTEGLNLVMKHPAFKIGNIVTTRSEHPALAEAISALRFKLSQKSDVEIREVEQDKNGKIDLSHLEELLDDKTSLLASHYVQSETGVIQDLRGIRKIMNLKAPNALFLVDSVQAIGKISIPWEQAKIDFIFISGHKIGVPFGGAVIFRNNKHKFGNYLMNFRTKHHSVARAEPSAALTLTEGVIQAVKDVDNGLKKTTELNKYARKKLSEINLKSGKIEFTTDIENSSPYILHFMIPGFQAAVLVRMLSKKEIMVASGSACMAETPPPSSTLIAMGFSRENAYSALRISFWRENTIKDIDKLASELQKIIDNY